MILPAAIRYQTEIAESVAALKAAGVATDGALLNQLSDLVNGLQTSVSGLEAVMSHHGAENSLEESKYFRSNVLPAMLKVREVADALEGVVADDLWPLPTYQEMLFIK